MEPDLPPLFPLPAYLRAARRAADLSQRELAARAGLSTGTVGSVESDDRPSDPHVSTVHRLLVATGHRLTVVGADGAPLAPATGRGPRDAALRRYPSHLDVRAVRDLDDWWYGPFLTTCDPLPPYTYDLSRARRDHRRHGSGIGSDDGRGPQGSVRSTP
jgi:transcriptional regulator with XRE-family HTH domain